MLAGWFLSLGAVGVVRAQSADWWTRLPCEYIPQSDAIFVGEVTAVTPDEKKNDVDWVTVEFVVREAIAGAVKDSKMVSRSSAYSADYIGVAAGKWFLVYLSKEDGKLILKGETKAINKAAADMDFLRGWDQKDPGARMFGRISLIAKSSLDKNSKQPLPAVNIEIRDEQKKAIQTTTDADGNYEVNGLSPGIYTVEVVFPAEGGHLIADGPSNRVYSKGCTQTDVDVHFKNELHGKIVDPVGKPVGKVPLELIPITYTKPRFDVEEPQELTRSNDDGTFVFYNAPPGKYNLAVNYTNLPEFESPYPASFLPGTPDRAKAQVIEIVTGKTIEGIKYVLGPETLKEKKVSGRVVYPDGHPAANAKVYLKEDENQSCCVLKEATTDAQGNFLLTGFGTHRYRIWTFVDHKPFTDKINFIGASAVFTLGGTIAPFQIVLKPTLKETLDAIDEIEMRERGKIK